jgi:hypothetical protein
MLSPKPRVLIVYHNRQLQKVVLNKNLNWILIIG